MVHDLRRRLALFPRLPLASYPTPLAFLPRLSDEVGRPVYIKRDDDIGPGLGGNKTRKLEYLLAEAQESGAHKVVTFGGLQSNFLRALARPAARPALVHCTTGKDRTGWAVASLMLYLGVSEADVKAEYMVSDLEVRRAFAHVVDDFVARGGAREVIEPLMSVHPSFLEAALEVMHAEYGSIEAYVRRGLGVEDDVLQALREAFLEPAAG